MQTKTQELVPASCQVAFDAAKDPVLEALRNELLELLSRPFEPRQLRMAAELVTHATDLLALKRGTNGRRRGRRFAYNSYGQMSDDDEEVLAGAPQSETMGTHAMRELVGVAAKALERAPASEEQQAKERAQAIQQISFAMQAARELPEELRVAALARLNGDLGKIISAETITVDAPAVETSQAVAAVATGITTALAAGESSFLGPLLIGNQNIVPQANL